MKSTRLTYIDAAKYAAIIFIIFSLLMSLLMYFGTSAFIPTGERPHFDKNVTTWMAVIGAVETYLYLFVLFSINFKILESRIKGRGKTLLIIVSTLAIALIFNLITAFFMKNVVIHNKMIPPDAHIGPLIKNIFFAAIVFFISFIVYLSSQKQRMILENEAMKAENERSRFEALKSQLDPHFLFNTLNTLDSLIQEEPKRARNYLQQLSSVFRYVISNKESTTLDAELKFAHNYNEIMQIRYENSLVFDFHVDEQYLDYIIVPLSIQTLIENAIKHNIISSESPFVISVRVGPGPEVIVSNKISQKKTTPTGAGIGLSNLAERFRLKLHKEIIISDTNGVFSVTIPLLSPKEHIS